MSFRPSKPQSPCVYIIDDDDAMRDAVRILIESVNLEVKTFRSADAFLNQYKENNGGGCIILDLRMPGMTGLELQEHLISRKILIPVIMITAHGSVRSAVRAVQKGAFDFIEKPFDDDVLLERVRRALDKDNETRQFQKSKEPIAERYKELTVREREILGLISKGLLSKQIADTLDISIRTVQNHRTHLMEKMGARNIADLVRMASTMGYFK